MWILNLDSEKAVRELAVATESEVKNTENFQKNLFSHLYTPMNG